MANIQTLSVSVVARTAGFTRGLDHAQKRLSSFSSGLKGSLSRLGGFGAALAGAAGGAGVVSLIKSTGDSIDKMSELSQRLGISTEDLTALSHVANLGGTSNEAFAKSLGIMNKTLGQAQIGSKSAEAAFANLGLDFQQLASAGTAESFLQIADVISTLADVTQQSSAAQAVFGRGGMQLLNVLQLGRAGLEAQTEATKRAGIAFNTFDAQGVNTANDALDTASKVLGSLVNRFVIELAPAITQSSNDFIAWANAGGDAAQSIRAGLSDTLDVISGIGKGIKVATSSFQLLASLGLQLTSSLSEPFSKSFSEMTGAKARDQFAKANMNFEEGFGLESNLEKKLKSAFGTKGFGGVLNETFGAEAFGGKSQEVLKGYFSLAETKAAQLKAKLGGGKLLDVPKLAKEMSTKATDIGQGLQIDLARTALGANFGAAKVQRVESDQLLQILEVLRQRLNPAAQGGAAVA